MTDLRAAAQQVLEALTPFVRGSWTPGLAVQAAAAMDRLESALAQDQLHDQQLRDDAERWRNIRGYVKAMEDEICALRSSLRAALAGPVQEPAPMPPFPPVSLWKRGCAVCGIGAGGHAYGYACPRSDCPTRVTCGGTV